MLHTGGYPESILEYFGQWYSIGLRHSFSSPSPPLGVSTSVPNEYFSTAARPVSMRGKRPEREADPEYSRGRSRARCGHTGRGRQRRRGALAAEARLPALLEFRLRPAERRHAVFEVALARRDELQQREVVLLARGEQQAPAPAAVHLGFSTSVPSASSSTAARSVSMGRYSPSRQGSA